MSITLTGPTENDRFEPSLNELKKTAVSFECLQAWCQKNPEAFGIHKPQDAYARVELDVDWIHLQYGEDYGNSSIAVTVMYDIHETLAAIAAPRSLLCNNQEFTRCVSVVQMLELSLDEWPFLTAELLAKNIDELDNVGKPNGVPFIQSQLKVLERYLPLHFPSFTYQTIQSMRDLELLPTADTDRAFAIAIGRFLSASHGEPSANLLSSVTSDFTV